MGFHTPMRLTASTVATSSTSHVATVPPSATATAAALLAAANAYVAAATLPYGAILAWIVPGLFLISVRAWRPLHAFLFGCAYGLVVGLGLGVAEGDTVDVLLGSLLAVDRGPALLSAALPFGLVAYAYAALTSRMPSSARGSFAAWLWPGAEVLRAMLAPDVEWTNLGATQALATSLSFGESSPLVVSFVMVLVSCTASELMLDRSALRIESRALVRWVALPAVALLALYVNLSTAVPATATTHTPQQPTISKSQLVQPLRAERGRRVVDRPVVTAGAVLTAI